MLLRAFILFTAAQFLRLFQPYLALDFIEISPDRTLICSQLLNDDASVGSFSSVHISYNRFFLPAPLLKI